MSHVRCRRGVTGVRVACTVYAMKALKKHPRAAGSVHVAEETAAEWMERRRRRRTAVGEQRALPLPHALPRARNENERNVPTIERRRARCVSSSVMNV